MAELTHYAASLQAADIIKAALSSGESLKLLGPRTDQAETIQCAQRDAEYVAAFINAVAEAIKDK